MLEKWKHLLDNGYNIGVLFMDLSKAFDVLNHSLLLAKLEAYGFSLKSTTFIQSYLNKRMQKVNVNNKFSVWEDIYSGVPQGSILGPLLFNIFINDIFSFLTTSEMCKYVDDNTLYTYSRHFHQVQEYLKKDSEILENWFYDNYVVLNPRKCEFMDFGKTNKNEVFTYHEIRLKKTTFKKLLGITIDDHLKFNEHLTNVCKRASRNLNALSRVSSFLSYQQKKVMSNSFISGQFNYCPLIRMFSSIRSCRNINKLHERSLRLCHNDYTSSYDEFLSKQDLVNIHVRNIEQLMIEIFKCLKGISPPIINDIFS